MQVRIVENCYGDFCVQMKKLNDDVFTTISTHRYIQEAEKIYERLISFKGEYKIIKHTAFSS